MTNEQTNAPHRFPFWDFCFVSCKLSDERTNGRTKRQTNERFALASPRVHPAVPRVIPCAVPRGKVRLMIKLGSQHPKNHSSHCEGCLAACLRERWSCDHHFAFADALEQRAQQRTKEATPPRTYLILSGSNAHGFQWRDISSRRDRFVRTRFRFRLQRGWVARRSRKQERLSSVITVTYP